MDFHLDAAFHARRDDYIPLIEGSDASRDHVAGAQADRGRGRQQDVARADSDSQWRSDASAHQWGFQHYRATVSGNTAIHRAALRADGFHHSVEDVLEPNQLRNGLLLRRRDDFVRCALGDDASCIEDEDVLAERENFFPAMRYVEDRNAVRLVPDS